MSIGLQPSEFWRLSALEWRWLTSQKQPLTLSEAQALARLYPDDPHDRQNKSLD